ncbi:MAG: hypothetical protein J1E64_14920 [Acetatifactor sp.]|nr:hypothetical protein [Acetatifactor sp.]
MARYDRMLLNALADTYERSLLFSGENKVNVRIAFPFTRKMMPDYFDESSLAYEEIHACVQDLECRGFLSVSWKRGKTGHIIDKVILNEGKLQEVYEYLHRVPKRQQQEQISGVLEQAAQEFQTPICASFVSYLQERLSSCRSVKEYIDIADAEGTKRIIRTVYLIEKNETPCYIREFSIRNFSDSKIFENLLGHIARIMHRFGDGLEGMELSDMLAEYNIYHTPNYVYFKGNIVLDVDGKTLSIGGLQQGIGVSGEDVSKISLQDIADINKVITIENLTTFFRWQDEKSLILYLGGYHNSVRRSLLNMIYQKLPNADYYHFGDIDVGGFEIYEDLCAKTGIPFKLYRMDVDTLGRYAEFGKTLTENDRKRINKIMDNSKIVYAETLQYMLLNNVKLEQECVEME